MHVVQEDLPLEQKENIGMKITGDSGWRRLVSRGNQWTRYNYTCIKDEITSC